jgi:hypothetical protein
MENDYWTYEDYFIFKPTFNGPIKNYIEIIKNYRVLIFSNYDNLQTNIELIRNSRNSYGHYVRSRFNRPLTTSFNELINLTQITFSNCFNKPLSNSLDKLTSLEYLTFGLSFNKPLSNSLN